MATLTNIQRKLFEDLHNSRTEDFKIFNKKSYKGVWSGIIDKYPESAHFVYELLQNADDARASEVIIILRKDKLLFKHNGTKHFNVTEEDVEEVGDINSITGIGDSSKTDTQNKIGKFGVGFKAVFQYTETPEIYDDYFKFKIENYIIPTLLNTDHPNREEGETLFVIPFKNRNAYKDIYNRLNKLQNPILFLHNIKKVVWKIEDDVNNNREYEYSKVVNDKRRYKDGVLLEKLQLNEPKGTRVIFLFSENVSINNDNNTSTHRISVGFYYDPKKKKLITEGKRKIFCFFPTKETFNTCFVSHAPFLLTDNRQNLKPGEQLNEELVNLLADLAAKSIVHLRDYKEGKDIKLINENIVDIIPVYEKESTYDEFDELFEQPIIDSFTNILNNERLLLSRNGKYLSIKESRIGIPQELLILLSQKQLSYLCDNDDYEDDELFEVQNIDFLKTQLAQKIYQIYQLKEDWYYASYHSVDYYQDIEIYKSEDLAQSISADFMMQQDKAWVIRFYKFLLDDAIKLWKITDKNPKASALPFRNATIIKTQKGDWVAPFINCNESNVYLSLKENQDAIYNFVALEYMEDDTAKQFFNDLGIKEPNSLDYIREVMLKKYELNEIDDEDLKSDFDILVKTYKEIRDTKEDYEKFIDLIKDDVLIFDTREGLSIPKNLYFSNPNLEKYFFHQTLLSFINLDFYDKTIKKYGKDIVREFLKSLGVCEYPKIIETKRSDVGSLTQGLANSIHIPEDAMEYSLDDFVLEGFEFFSNRYNPKKNNKKTNNEFDKNLSLYLWNEVLPSIDFAKYQKLKLTFRPKYARDYKSMSYDSTFIYCLRHRYWIVDNNDKVCSPATIAFEDLAPEYNRNNGLIEFLGIEKKEKSILELGGTEEQQEDMELGKLLRQAGIDSKEKLKEVLALATVQKGSTCLSEKENIALTPIEGSTTLLNQNRTTNIDIENNTDNLHNNKSNTESIHTIEIFKREELTIYTKQDQFVATPRKQSISKQKKTESAEEEKNDNVMQQLIDQEEKYNKIKELRGKLSTLDKYTKEWFETLIDLEYKGGTMDNDIDYSKAIKISFNSVHKEESAERIYIFENPSRIIPFWMEEISDIEVKCYFSNHDELTLKFEVANVRQNSLRLKASKSYEDILHKIEWGRFTKATIVLKNQIDLIGKVRIAFNDLGLEDGFNLKSNLDNRLKFIFGPPGTGKTTTLAKKIIDTIRDNKKCKILVLAPTNTACDELSRKIIQYSQNDCIWLSRFVSTADEALENIVVDRDSLVYNEDKCCIISTVARLSFDGFNGAGGFNRLADIVWDYVICDEASMIPLVEILLAIYNFTNTPIIIAGDPMQIKPILREEEWRDENIYTMVKLDRFDNPKTEPIQFDIENLGTQYRSIPVIGQLFSEYAYDGKLKHYRQDTTKETTFGNLKLSPINFISFKVEKYDSIFGVKKLDGSNVHIYSVLFTIELVKYILNNLPSNIEQEFSIGIVCPYSSQAQIIESLIQQISNIPSNVKFIVGTVHRFQGGQCKFIIVVLNPPLGMKNAPERIFLNNKNILNVAISRAQDYLCVLLPHKDTEGYENLYEINALGRIAIKNANYVSSYTSDQIEEILFRKKFYIENNTFVTSHQLTNVYTKTNTKYEVRIDEKSVDIQLGSDKGNRNNIL